MIEVKITLHFHLWTNKYSNQGISKLLRKFTMTFLYSEFRHEGYWQMSVKWVSDIYAMENNNSFNCCDSHADSNWRDMSWPNSAYRHFQARGGPSFEHTVCFWRKLMYVRRRRTIKGGIWCFSLSFHFKQASWNVSEIFAENCAIIMPWFVVQCLTGFKKALMDWTCASSSETRNKFTLKIMYWTYLPISVALDFSIWNSTF